MYKRRMKLLVLLACIIMAFPMVVCASQYEYDELNRVTKAIFEDGSYVTYEYDANGNITDIASYDSVGQLVTEEPTEAEKPTEPDETDKPTEPEPPIEPENPTEPEEQPTFMETVETIINTITSVIKDLFSKIFGIFMRG